MLIPSPTRFSTKVNKRPVGVYQQITNELNYITADAPYTMQLTEVPVAGNPLYPVVINGYNQVQSDPTGQNECRIDYSNGIVYFDANPIHANAGVTSSYYGTGSVVVASDMNRAQVAINDLENSVELITSGDGNLTVKNVLVEEDLTVNGDLNVLGTVVETLKVKDNVVTLNYGTPAGMDAGIEIARGLGNPMPTFQWVEATSSWKIVGLVGGTPYATFSPIALTSNTNIVPGVTLLTIGTPTARFNKIYIDGGIDFSGDFVISKNGTTVLSTEADGKLAFAEMVNLVRLAADPALDVSDIGSIYYDNVNNQFKGIKADGVGNPVMVILG